jgi:hypothetical protein
LVPLLKADQPSFAAFEHAYTCPATTAPPTATETKKPSSSSYQGISVALMLFVLLFSQ